jgi:hypothetical protein
MSPPRARADCETGPRPCPWRSDTRTELAGVVADLGSEELRVLLWVARRLLDGQARYGRLNLARDSRDFRREAGEEAVDALAYLAMGALRRGKWR